MDNQPTGDDQLLLIRRRKAAAALEGRQVPTPSLLGIFGASSIGARRQEPPAAPRLGAQLAPEGLAAELAADNFVLGGETLSEAPTSAGPSTTTSPTSTPAQSPRQQIQP